MAMGKLGARGGFGRSGAALGTASTPTLSIVWFSSPIVWKGIPIIWKGP